MSPELEKRVSGLEHTATNRDRQNAKVVLDALRNVGAEKAARTLEGLLAGDSMVHQDAVKEAALLRAKIR